MQETVLSWHEILQFYKQAGVDIAVSEETQNRFLEKNFSKPIQNHSHPAKTAIAQPTIALPPTQILPVKAIPGDAQIITAQTSANQAQTLEELKKQLEAFDGCRLKITAKNTCFSDGTAGSALMIIGDAPGREEDDQGVPFVGSSGQLLNQILTAMGLKRDEVYIANTIPWRPPGNRQATAMEIELCRPFLEKQIELAQPKVLLALGDSVAKLLTNSKEMILRLRGNWHQYHQVSANPIPVMPTFHPTYLLRTPSQKKYVWQDCLMVKAYLREIGAL